MRSPTRLVFAGLAAILGSVGCTSPATKASPAPSASSAGSVPKPQAAAPQSPEDRLAPLRRRTYSIAIEGSLAHAGTEAGVVTYDLSNPAEPKQLASITLAGSVNNVTLIGGSTRIAAALGPDGLALIDGSAARDGKLTLLNPVPWPPAKRGACHAVWKAVSANATTAYAACGTGGVAEIDVRVPSDPGVTRLFETEDYVRDVAILQGEPGAGTVVAAAGHDGLLVLEFGKTGAPKVVARVPTTGETRAVAIQDARAYLVEGAAGFRIVDLRAPSKPVVLGQLRPPSTDMLRGIAVSGTTAWVCAGDSGVMAIDVSDPASPKLARTFDPERAVNRAATFGTLLVAANDADGLLILDASDPKALRAVFPKPGAPAR